MTSVFARYWAPVLVVLLAVAAQAEVWTEPAQEPRLVTAPAALLWTLPLLAAGRFPLGAPVVVFAVLGGLAFLPHDVVTSSQLNGFAIIGAFGAAGTHPDMRRGLAGAGVGLAAVATIVLNDLDDVGLALPIVVLGGISWGIGRALAERGRRAEGLRERAERLEHEHEAALSAERSRIARELHDVIAHSVSVMTVQAGAARLMLDEDPARAREPLMAVERTGRQALGEMRRLLGILRGGGGDDAAALEPQPGIGQIDALVEQVRSAGLPVDIAVEGRAQPLPPGVDLAAYRIVQEALTNVIKHAGPARAQVRVRYGSDTVELEVIDDGRAAHANGQPDPSSGHGLVGMQQRVALYGGEVQAGPRPEGGYAVRARLPVRVDES